MRRKTGGNSGYPLFRGREGALTFLEIRAGAPSLFWNFRRAMRVVVEYSEEKRFESMLLGGSAVEVEAAASKLGRNRENGLVRLGRNKA